MSAQDGTVARVLEIARAELGTEENPRGSNRTKYGEEYGMDGVAWCAMFVWWVFREAGVPLPVKTAYTPTLAAAFQKEKRWLSNVSKDVEPGDVVLFYWPSMGRIAHTGIVEKVLPNGDVQTIEGNSDVAGGRSGGKVVRQIRSRATVHAHGGFGVPRYEEEDEVTGDDRKFITDAIAAAVSPIKADIAEIRERLGAEYGGPVNKALYTGREDRGRRATGGKGNEKFAETPELILEGVEQIEADVTALKATTAAILENTKRIKP